MKPDREQNVLSGRYRMRPPFHLHQGAACGFTHKNKTNAASSALLISPGIRVLDPPAAIYGSMESGVEKSMSVPEGHGVVPVTRFVRGADRVALRLGL